MAYKNFVQGVLDSEKRRFVMQPFDQVVLPSPAGLPGFPLTALVGAQATYGLMLIRWGEDVDECKRRVHAVHEGCFSFVHSHLRHECWSRAAGR
jgi:hypothetical protein